MFLGQLSHIWPRYYQEAILLKIEPKCGPFFKPILGTIAKCLKYIFWFLPWKYNYWTSFISKLPSFVEILLKISCWLSFLFNVCCFLSIFFLITKVCENLSIFNYGNTSTDHVSSNTYKSCSRYCQKGNSDKNLAHIWNFVDFNFVKKIAKFGGIF